MGVKSIVKVMNFHSLLRVNAARRKVEHAVKYEDELKNIISNIVNNRIFVQEQSTLKLNENGKELNIYIGSDLGFCANFNSDVISYIRSDDPRNDKIIIGKKVKYDVPNIILYMNKEDFVRQRNHIFDLVLDGILKNLYSKINLIYIHYYNMSRQEIVKRTILPFDFNGQTGDDQGLLEDYVVEGDLNYIIWNMVSSYVSAEITIAEAWSWASENVKRQSFTNESLKKIEEVEEENLRVERKEKRAKGFKVIVEMNNKKNAPGSEEE